MEDTQYNNRRSRSRKRCRKRKSCVFFKTFITVFAIFSLFLIGSRVLTPWFSGELTTEQMDGVGDNFSSIPETVQPDTSIVPQMAEIDLENLYSPYAILVDLDSGTVLKEKNSTDRIYPYSPKETRPGALRRCGPTHGGVKAQRVSCRGDLAGRRLSYNGQRSLSPPDRCWP